MWFLSLGRANDLDDDDIRVNQARFDERLKVVEKDQETLNKRMWGAVVLILAYVANKVLGLLDVGGV